MLQVLVLMAGSRADLRGQSRKQRRIEMMSQGMAVETQAIYITHLSTGGQDIQGLIMLWMSSFPFDATLGRLILWERVLEFLNCSEKEAIMIVRVWLCNEGIRHDKLVQVIRSGNRRPSAQLTRTLSWAV